MEKICTGILIERVRRVTEKLIGWEQSALRTGGGCVDQIFKLKQMCNKGQGPIFPAGNAYPFFRYFIFDY